MSVLSLRDRELGPLSGTFVRPKDGADEAAATAGVVLLVDDDPAVLRAYTRLLTKAGLRVECAPLAKEAVERVAAGARFDAIVSDVAMPGASGLELLSELRRHDACVPVLLMTGAPDLDGAVVAMERGAFRYLPKPVSPERLVDDVRKAVHQARAARTLKAQPPRCDLPCAGCASDRPCRVLESALVELTPVFQPIVSWRAQAAYGFEALLRCRQPGLERPDRLFALAERFGALPRVGRAMRARVAAEAAALPAGATLFVNVHPAEVFDEALFDVEAPLSRVADRVVLEITERSSVADVVDMVDRLRALRDMGYRIAIDDLGAGYAGLSSFSLLEPDIVKLDMSLIRGVDTQERKRRVVRSLLSLCEGELGVRAVCEGIETVAERDALVDIGADLLQGYLFARPAAGFTTSLSGLDRAR